MPVIHRRPASIPGIPDWLQKVVGSITPDPVSELMPTPLAMAAPLEPMIEALGKPVSEMLGRVFEQTGAKAPGIPRRLMVSGWNAAKGVMQFHPTPAVSGSSGLISNMGKAEIEATPAQLSHLIDSGVLGYEDASPKALGAIGRKLKAALGGVDPAIAWDEQHMPAKPRP